MQIAIRGVVVLVVVAAVWYGIHLYRNQTPLRALIGKGEMALLKGDKKLAEEVAAQVKRRAPDAPETQIYLTQVLMQQNKYDEAWELIQKVPAGTPDTVDARGIQGRIAMAHRRDLTKAEELFREALKQDPNSTYCIENLELLLQSTGRYSELVPLQLQMLKQRHPALRRVILLALMEEIFPDSKTMQEIHQKHPQDFVSLAALAEANLRLNKLDESIQQSREVILKRPDLIDTYSRLGRALLEKNDQRGLVDWSRSLPAEAEKSYKVWNVRGDWACQLGQTKVAIRCFWESLKLNGAQLHATFQLGTLLRLDDSGDTRIAEGARRLQIRAAQLNEYHSLLRLMTTTVSKEPNKEAFFQAANQAKILGLFWESQAFIELLIALKFEHESLEDLIKELAKATDRLALVRMRPESNLALKLDLSKYPLPEWKPEDFPPPATNAPAQGETIAFQNLADQANLKFQYVNGGDPKLGKPQRMQETLGGGVAILDYDQDGFPDIYLTQGTALPTAANQKDHLDRLFRNLGNGQFEDVTQAAGIEEDRYSHGVSAGDYNNDGFPDLYVANVGRNRLYLNNGDGTFTDNSSPSGTLAGDFWSTSCAIADINLDGYPDLYSVNYLVADALKANCNPEANKDKSAESVQPMCLPRNFASAPDQLYLSLGRGLFRDITKSIGIQVPDGRGLGIQVADLDGSGKLSLFLTQDGPHNPLLFNTAKNGQDPKFEDRAWSSGLALLSNGNSPVPYGSALGQTDGRGMLDLVVTGRSTQGTVLYHQDKSLSFVDHAVDAGVKSPSFKVTGFGVQFLDVDLDGNLDFIQANGDTRKAESSEIDYESSPLIFRNQGKGTFQSLTGPQLGPYFSGKYLGRSVARVDWNRDGLEDVVVTHLDQPVALLTNQTQKAGHFLRIRLCGTTVSRDAIGSTVTLKVGDQRISRQLTAGDGYQASNERCLVFGLGTATKVEEISVQWAGGKSQQLSGAEVDRELLIVEGQPTPSVLWKK